MRFREEVNRRFRQRVAMRNPRAVFLLALIIFILTNAIYYCYAHHQWGVDAANQAVIQSLILVGLAEVLLFLGVAIIWYFFEIPDEIYSEQQSVINNSIPKKLNIFVDDSPLGGKINKMGEHVLAAMLTVINQETRKIVEFRAIREELLQRTAKTPDDIWGSTFMARWFTFYFAWQNGNTEEKILPGQTLQLQIAELDPSNGRPLFGAEEFQSPAFDQQAIYEFHVRFMGKLEGETEFRYYDYGDELYCDPRWPDLRFAEQALINGIPDELVPKILHVRKKKEKTDEEAQGKEN